VIDRRFDRSGGCRLKFFECLLAELEVEQGTNRSTWTGVVLLQY
jgi:hypothetical protein